MPANFLVLNKTCHKILQTYLKDRKFRDSDYLFISQKRNKEGKKVLDPRSVNASIKLWCKDAGLTGQFGTHTMRKTFGYLQYAHFKTDINILCERFKHSSPAITRRYIGITEDTVQNCLLNEI
jgi:integrase